MNFWTFLGGLYKILGGCSIKEKRPGKQRVEATE